MINEHASLVASFETAHEEAMHDHDLEVVNAAIEEHVKELSPYRPWRVKPSVHAKPSYSHLGSSRMSGGDPRWAGRMPPAPRGKHTQHVPA
jgi:hypothetical protein